jgi:hypothetical protein
VSSSYFFGGRGVHVSNGSAAFLDAGWLRLLREWGEDSSEPGRSLAGFLEQIVEIDANGMLGFHLARGPLESAEARRLFARLVEGLALEIVEAIHGQPRHESLAFLATHTPFFKAYWIAVQQDLHALVRESLAGEREPLELPLEEPLRKAAKVVAREGDLRLLIRMRSVGSAELDPTRELELRRELCALSGEVVDFFGADRVARSLSELGDLEESMGLLQQAAESTRRSAELEPDPELAQVMREIAEARARAAAQR